MDLHASAVATLRAWQAPSPEQARLRDAYLDHLSVYPDGVWRHGPPAHLTASCFVFDPPGARVLLTFHRKGRFWVQFGGHCEADDATLADAARREALEESGLPDLRVFVEPVDLDRHALPPQFRPCGEHLDVAFLAIAPDGAQPRANDESDEVAWWPVDNLPDGIVSDLPARLARARIRLRPK